MTVLLRCRQSDYERIHIAELMMQLQRFHLMHIAVKQVARIPMSSSRWQRTTSCRRVPTRVHKSAVSVSAARVDAATTEETNLLDPTAPAVLTAEEILQILPHRYPFLFVDRVTYIVEKETIVGLKNVTMNDNFFPGHFPDRPIMPGVLQVEALAQLAGILALQGADESAKSTFFFGGVDKVRFKKPVVPGDTLMLKVDINLMKRGIVKAHGESYVAGEVTCTADLTLVVAPSTPR